MSIVYVSEREPDDEERLAQEEMKAEEAMMYVDALCAGCTAGNHKLCSGTFCDCTCDFKKLKEEAQ